MTKNFRRVVLGVFTVLTMSVLVSTGLTKDVKAATYDDINAKEVFIKQKMVDSCTLCSAAMMIRRALIMKGDPNWASYTESKVATKAWSDGLFWNFEVNGIKVTRDSLSGTAAQKKSYLINMLNQHPEGIVLYYSGDKPQPHAVLLTEYTNGKFYCAEPWGGKPEGVIPLSDAIAVTASNADVVWYVTTKLPALTEYASGTQTVPIGSANNTVSNLPVNETSAVTTFANLNSNLLPSNYKKMKVSGLKLSSKKANTLSLSWSKQSNISGYKIQYSQSKKFTNAKTKKVGKKTSQVDLSKLKSGKTYYVRICAYKKNASNSKNVYYKYSTVKKIKVK